MKTKWQVRWVNQTITEATLVDLPFRLKDRIYELSGLLQLPGTSLYSSHFIHIDPNFKTMLQSRYYKVYGK